MSKATDDAKKRLAERLRIKLKEKSREELEDLLIDKIYGDGYSTCTDVIRKTLQKDLPTIVVEELKELCKNKEFLSKFIMTSSNYNDKIQVPQNWITELLASSRDSRMFDDIQKEIHEHLKENYREILIEAMKRIILNGIATSPNIGNVISDAISNSKDW